MTGDSCREKLNCLRESQSNFTINGLLTTFLSVLFLCSETLNRYVLRTSQKRPARLNIGRIIVGVRFYSNLWEMSKLIEEDSNSPSLFLFLPRKVLELFNWFYYSQSSNREWESNFKGDCLEWNGKRAIPYLMKNNYFYNSNRRF